MLDVFCLPAFVNVTCQPSRTVSVASGVILGIFQLHASILWRDALRTCVCRVLCNRSGTSDLCNSPAFLPLTLSDDAACQESVVTYHVAAETLPSMQSATVSCRDSDASTHWSAGADYHKQA